MLRLNKVPWTGCQADCFSTCSALENKKRSIWYLKCPQKHLKHPLAPKKSAPPWFGHQIYCKIMWEFKLHETFTFHKNTQQGLYIRLCGPLLKQQIQYELGPPVQISDMVIQHHPKECDLPPREHTRILHKTSGIKDHNNSIQFRIQNTRIIQRPYDLSPLLNSFSIQALGIQNSGAARNVILVSFWMGTCWKKFDPSTSQILVGSTFPAKAGARVCGDLLPVRRKLVSSYLNSRIISLRLRSSQGIKDPLTGP